MRALLIFVIFFVLYGKCFCQETIIPFCGEYPDSSKCTNEEELLKKFHSRVRKRSYCYSFYLDNKKVREGGNEICDLDGEGRGDTYITFRGYLKSINFYVIHRSFYEAGDYVLINTKNGDTTAIGGKPYVSMDKKHILINDPSLINIISRPNVIEIWEMINNKPHLQWNNDTANYEIHNPRWVNNNRVEFDKWIYDGSPEIKTSKACIMFENNQWKVIGN